MFVTIGDSMKIYETVLQEVSTVKIRVKANSEEEAKSILDKFNKIDAQYLSDELDLNGEKIWIWGELLPCKPSKWDEAATISRNEDGSLNAEYEGGEE